MINKEEFLDTIFGDVNDDEYVCVTRAQDKKDGGSWFMSVLDDNRKFTKWKVDRAQAWYFCVSSVNGELNAKGTMIGRGRANLLRYHCLVLDDIGTKATPPPVAPTWKIETSEGNYQWGYALHPGADFTMYEAAVEWCHKQGWGDEGAGGSYRVMRLPGSANMKPGRDEFRAVVTDWAPDLVWSLSGILDALGCDAASLSRGKVKVGAAKPFTVHNVDPVIDWLIARGEKDVGDVWVEVECPWAAVHTNDKTTAGYSPLGRGVGYEQTRSFRCFHAHCVGRNYSDYRNWIITQGGEDWAGYDPLGWLQGRYVYIEDGMTFADMDQRPHGGYWRLPIQEWDNRHPLPVPVPWSDKSVRAKVAMLSSTVTRRAARLAYDPGGPVVSMRDNQQIVNSYTEPTWEETTVDPVIFLDHMDFLLPVATQRETVLDWLAHKIQNPGMRSFAVLMIAENSYGTGRSWISSMLRKTLQGNVETASLAQLIGQGTTGEQNYNDWGAECLFLCVEEARANLERAAFFNGYETFKERVDTRVLPLRVNPKYGKTRDDFMFFNALIFSNHSDAMNIPEGDRRLYVVENPKERRDYAYYDRLNSALDNDTEAARLYWWLKRRDLGGFDHVYPAMTEAKAEMIDTSVSKMDEIDNWVMEHLEGDIVTREQVRQTVKEAGRDLGFAGVEADPGNITGRLWKCFGRLRKGKNGARYMLGKEQIEVRAIRDKKSWVEVDKARLSTKIEEELKKNA